MRLRLDLAYNGAAYHGWQIQKKPLPPPTVQGALEAAFFKLAGQPVCVTASGRTDAGVHAWRQVAHVDVVKELPDWAKSLNAVLPADIRVLAARRVADDFHARRDAVAKTYVYQFWQGQVTPPLLANQVWSTGPLARDAMLEAASRLVGEHDFASFQNAGTPVRSTVRRIYSIGLETARDELLYPEGASLWRLVVTGNGFLRQMVRNLAGLLAWIGRGVIEPVRVGAFLAACDRRLMPAPTAPAQGLGLFRVWYEADALEEFMRRPPAFSPQAEI